MIETARLLGFAFAGADLLFEIDTAGLILFAAGATTRFADRSDLVGQPVRNLFLSREQSRLDNFVKGIKPGDRLGPLPLMLASGEKAVLCLCYLPQNERISCTLVKIDKWPEQPLPAQDAETGLPDGDAFLSVATKNAGSMGAVALVNVPELSQACASLAPKESASLLAGIGTAVKGMG